MNVLLVRNYPLIDGTFTLLIRIAQNLEATGNKAYLLCLTPIDPKIEADIKNKVRLLNLSDLQRMQAAGCLPSIDVIHGILSGEAILVTYNLLKRKYFPKASVVTGAYHPYFLRDQRNISFTPDAILHRRWMKKIPDSNIVFMNNAVQGYVESYFNKKFPNSSVIPLPVNMKKDFQHRTHINKGKIVSIGRLVSMKNYPLGVIRAIHQLNQNGRQLEYHIYGSGPLQGEIEMEIVQLGMQKQVFLHGDIPYSEMTDVLKDALLFVGLGTAIIEASALGIPALLAIGGRWDKCYGFFHETAGYTVGEPLAQGIEYNYDLCIMQVLAANIEEYATLERHSHEKALLFEEERVMKKYHLFYQQADPEFEFYTPEWVGLLMKVLRQPFKLIRQKISY